MATTKPTEQDNATCTAVVGELAPDFELPSVPGPTTKLSDYRGKKVVLYFYPKDNTSGCTVEAIAFENNLKKLQEAGYCVLGISRDSISSHEKFKQKANLSFPLLSDADETVCKAYGVLKQKNMYGKTYMGIERSTFLIDENGILEKEYRKVKAKSHVDDLMSDLTE
ncbi:MAG: thioredoxin-dependent thiol peroxidase [Burkholderiales bacterium]|nr:thioredoxin-dependent thiol peroxidase [Burkholderiales bacterium]